MRKFFIRIAQLLAVVLALLFFMVSLLFLSVSMGIFGPLPTKAELAAIHNEEASLVLASDGSLLGKYFAENRTNISWEEVPQHLINALIATEDKRFYLHEGYDSRSYLRVFVKTILLGDHSAGGGSTLTQQLIKNLYGRNDHSLLSMPVNKLKEAILASRLEDVFTKEEILLLYLNSVPFGEEVYGIEAAAKRYYDKHASALSVQESAVLVGILKANTLYNPRTHPKNALARRNQILGLMANEGFISPSQSDSLKLLPLNLKYANYLKDSPAAYFVNQVRKRVASILEDLPDENGTTYDIEKDGLRIYTTLDISLQKFAVQAARQHLEKMQKLLDNELKRTNKRKAWQKQQAQRYEEGVLDATKNREVFDWGGVRTSNMSLADSLWHYYKMLHAAVLIAEPNTGRVLGWVGGNHFRYLPYDMVYARRQIASAIKPLIYAAALEKGLSPCSYLGNEVKKYSQFNDWQPENYDRHSSKDSLVALWYALANSMNLPTVDLYFQTGYNSVADLLRRLDLEVPYEEAPAIALGALDVSLYEIVRAYSTFANRGAIFDELTMIDKITDAGGKTIYSNPAHSPAPVIRSDITDQLTVILERAINEGTGTSMRNHFGLKSDLAGKTGTAQNYSDAWFMAYTPDLVIGTWVGARSHDMHFQSGLGSGSALALPISGKVLSNIERDPKLSAKYLSRFNIDPLISNMIDCPPYYEKGFSGFFNRLTGNVNGEGNSTGDSIDRNRPEQQKKKSGFRRFFDNIFKKK